MKHLRILIISAAVTVCLNAQPANQVKSADDDWAAIIKLITPMQSERPPAGTKRTPSQRASELAQKAATARQAAQSAKTFYSTYPTNYKVNEARKLEAIQSLLGIVDNDNGYEQAAQRTAKAYRDDRSNAATDRFEVALLSERIAERAKLGGTAYGHNSAELEKIADKLRIEFGDIPDAFNFYISIARSSDMVTARRIAGNVENWRAGPEAKEEARAILTRNDLLNKPLTWTLTNIDSVDAFDLAKQSGKITVIYAWQAASGSEAFASLGRIKTALAPHSQVVYLALGATAKQVQAVKSAAPIPGVFCTEDRGVLGPTAEQFRIRHTPYVFVLNRAGVLVGFGPASELSNLLPLAGR